MPTLIKSIKTLKEKSKESTLSCYVRLNSYCKSSKDITYHPKDNLWFIYNYVDDTEQELSTEELSTHTIIAEAIENKALWQYDD